MRETRILGIETSCDETAAAVVVRTHDGKGCILSNVVRSQWEDHSAFGGVVPEIAARAHVACLDEIIEEAMRDAGLDFPELSAIAVTAGPGLIGGLIVGVTTAKSVALAHGLPVIGVNHLEAHALTVGLTGGLAPPYLLLLVSGGHSQVLFVKAAGQYERIATTIDDALGEAFDKVAKMLGLGMPGGPMVETWAAKGHSDRFDFPRPMRGRAEPHFSFAGLKTAVRKQAQDLAPVCDQDIADIAASFQAAVCDCIEDRLGRVIQQLEARPDDEIPRHLVVAGGVAANLAIRGRLEVFTQRSGLHLEIPPLGLCTDNAVMVAWTGAVLYSCGHKGDKDIVARARWPLDGNSAPLLGAGRLGAKA